MVQQGSIIGKITEELGELGKKVVTETAKAPVDIAGQLFEKGSNPKATVQPGQESQKELAGEKEKTPLDELDQAKDEKVKREMARSALEWIMGKRKKPPKPSVYEEKQAEGEQKKEKTKQQSAVAAWQKLPDTGRAPKRGDFRNIAKKQAGTETSRNVRQD